MKAIPCLIIIFAAVSIFNGVPWVITYYGRLYKWEGFGTVPFSENYSVVVLIFVCIFVFIIVPFSGLVFSIVSNHKP